MAPLAAALPPTSATGSAHTRRARVAAAAAARAPTVCVWRGRGRRSELLVGRLGLGLGPEQVVDDRVEEDARDGDGGAHLLLKREVLAEDDGAAPCDARAST
eukprot:537738-Prymnesium_polylepis.1